MHKIIVITVFIFFTNCMTHAQTMYKIGANPTIINNSAALEIESVTKGFLPPRMTTAQRDAIVFPALGLVVYNTTSKELQVWNGTIWSVIGNNNLGNHTATRVLKMENNSIDNVNNVVVNTQILMSYSPTKGTDYSSFAKKRGHFTFWGDITRFSFLIDETTGTSSMLSAALTKGTDNSAPSEGDIVTVANNDGDIVWKHYIPKSIPINSDSPVIIPENSTDNYFIVANANTNFINQISLPDSPRVGSIYVIRNTNHSDSLSVSNNLAILNVNGTQIKMALIPPGETITFCNVGHLQWYTDHEIPVN